ISDGMSSGIIERNTDVDFFQFTTTGGDVIIDPFFESPNLDILATLYDSSGTVIQTSNPIGALNACFIGLVSGTYYVSIEGTGEGDVLGTGYSDYGSLGQYTVLVTGQPPTVDVVGNVTISNSTISNNFAGTRGGGLLNQDTVDISNVTFSGNEAGKQGGAIHNTGGMTINNTTIYDNFTEGTGGGIYSVDASASVSVKNTIVAGNNALVSGYDLAGTFTSQGYNLIGSGGTSTGFIDGFNGDIVGTNSQRVDPALSVLQDNGGPTLTHALLTGSRAIDAGDNTDGVSVDQRGATRPTDTTSDIGAFEIVTPTITIADVSQVETDTGTVFKFIVSLSNANVDEVTVDFETSNITATAGVDYQFTTGTVTFAAGETTQVIEVVVNGDVLPEDHETFSVNLYNAQGAVIGTTHGTGTILNDETNLIITDAPDVMEGPAGVNTNMNFTVELSHPVTDIVTVDFETLAHLISGGTAEEGIDFVAVSGQTITFDPADYAEGEAFKQIVSVQVIGDTDIEPDENLFVELSNINSTISTIFTSVLQAEGTILNDDNAYLSIGDATMVEPEDGSGPAIMRFTLTLSHQATSTLDVDIITTQTPSITQPATGLDPATPGSDYQEDDGGFPFRATFNAGEDTAYFDVEIYGDSFDEDTEFFYVEITGTAGFSIELGKKIGIGRIIDDGEGLVVTTTDDELDPVFDPTDLSLREAIDFINNDSTGNYHTIVLPTGMYDMTRAGINENNNVLGDFDIKKDMTIVGDGSGLTIIDAHDLDRIFHSIGGATLGLSDMTLINGAADDGGAIYAEGDLTLNRVIFQDNNADFLGGAIVSTGQLNITDAQFLNNHAGFQGGAIYQYSSTASVGRTTFSGNTSDGRAGAVYVATDASFDVSQSLFYNNESGSRGGAIFNEGTVTSTNVTFSENHVGSRGGAIFNTGKLTLLNNTLTLNTADQTGGGISNDSAANPNATAKLTNTIV
ncbi:MAG: hypothetical protein KDA74_12085, partial [Planctomycetaceae bacterium]|nr:hypothetical protein [Planctomycetaceae bacterium]